VITFGLAVALGMVAVGGRDALAQGADAGAAAANERADEAKTPVERFAALMREGQPAEGSNAAEEVRGVAAWVRERTKVIVAEKAPAFDPRMVSFAEIADPKADPEAVRVARVVLAGLVAEGLDERVARLAACTRWIRESDGSPLLDDLLPQLGEARLVARLNVGRMAVAAEAGDWEAWLTTFDQSLALGALVARDPVLICHLVGVAIHATAFDRARAVIASGRLDAATLARIDARIRAHQLPDLRRALGGERCMALDTLDFVYERGPDAVKWLQGGLRGEPPAKPREPVVKEGDALGPGMPSLREQRRVFAEHYDWLEQRATLKILDRRGQAGGKGVEDNLLLGLLAPAVERALAADDQIKADRVGVRTLVALERFRLERGGYPAALAELVPGFVDEVVDPGTGATLGYRPPAGGPYAGGRAFVLYASGTDGDDDGGAVNFEDPMLVNRDPADGDLLLNR
jgi:hypothetical protein